MKKIIFILGIIILIYLAIHEHKVTLGPGVFAPDEPVQKNLTDKKTIQFKDCLITFLAEYQITAKVLSKENYYFDATSKISPTDLALGWGKMSDESILKDISISQSGRWYSWRVKKFPIPRKEIETHSANTHIIPADEYVEYMLKEVRVGQIIKIKGYLVLVKWKNGSTWRSSLTRNDVGNGACEVLYAVDLVILKG